MYKIDAVILAGGLGTRLRSAIGDAQKVMARVGEDPFITKIVRQIKNHGINHAIICTGYKAKEVESYLKNEFEGVRISYSFEEKALGTAGAIRNALDLIQTDPFLVFNGDSFCDAKLDEFIKDARSRQALASILLTCVEDSSRYGRVELSGTNEIIAFEEKGTTKGKGFINAGIYYLKKSVIEELPLEESISIERQVFPTLIGKHFFGHPAASLSFIDIGLPETLEKARSEEKRKITLDLKRYRAVLFDFDGVLSDSHGDNVRAWRKAFVDMDIPFNETEYLLLEGKKSPEIIDGMLKSLGLDPALATELIRIKYEYHAKDSQFRLYSGAQELVQLFKDQGVKVAVVSGGSKQRLFSGEGATFLKTFHTVITGEDCSRTKPDPEPYLKAAEIVGVSAKECLVIENAPLGIQAAKRAGMDCVAICSTLPISALNNADWILPNLETMISTVQG